MASEPDGVRSLSGLARGRARMASYSVDNPWSQRTQDIANPRVQTMASAAAAQLLFTLPKDLMERYLPAELKSSSALTLLELPSLGRWC